jgi:hypothetical protein
MLREQQTGEWTTSSPMRVIWRDPRKEVPRIYLNTFQQSNNFQLSSKPIEQKSISSEVEMMIARMAYANYSIDISIWMDLVNKETIWHFSCKECNGWWSIANTDNWKPKKLFCTHCGEPYVNDTKRIHKKITKGD